MRAKHPTDDIKFWKNVIPTDGCWHWTAPLTPSGYGRIRFRKRMAMAHRVALSILRGVEVPDGMEVDHLCRNKACVNPDHLEIVSHLTNVRRGNRCKHPESP